MVSTTQARTGAAPVVVVGAGVVGSAVALRLTDAGLPVVVVDPGTPRASASWAAGGMLSPLAEAPGEGAFLRLGVESLGLYPGFVARLEARSGRSVGLDLSGKLLTASDPEGVDALAERFAWQEAGGHPVRWLDGASARELEPGLTRDVGAAILLEGDGRVNNRALLQALDVALDRAGVRRVRGRVEGVEAVSRGAARARVRLRDGSSVAARRVVVAAGVWSREIRGLAHAAPLRPVKGQMLSFAVPRLPIERVVTSPSAYLIPRVTDDGPRVVVGASTEDRGFDTSTDPETQRRLQESAAALVPSLAHAPVAERWAGLRPGTPDDAPLLGPDPDLPFLIHASGHYRNGILLAPVTAERVLSWCVDEDAAVDPAFDPGRFPALQEA